MKTVMTKDVEKLRKLVNENLGASRNQIRKIFGTPSKKSDNGVWSYRNFRFSLFNDEVLFVFEDDVVVDISINKYFLWVETKSIFYMEYQNQEYKEVSLF